MSANGEPDITTNAGRCDICGKLIDMRDGGDKLSISEFGVMDEEVKEEYDLDDEDAIYAVAQALEAVAETPEGYELAASIRETGWMRVHGDCLEKTNFDQLEGAVPDE